MVGVKFQPTILVKKADGTTERITLAELKKRQAGISPVSTVSTTAIAPVSVVPVVTPVIPVSLPKTEIPAAFKSEDTSSLLSEEVPNSEHATTVIAPARLDQVDKIIAQLSFKVQPQIENRLHSCVQLRLKDIRSEADTVDTCLRSIKDGGLGLTQTQAQELVLKSKPSAAVANNPPKEKEKEKETVVEKIIQQSAATQSDSIAGLVAKPNTSPTRPLSGFSKPLMHDVKAKPVSMSPLEEIQFFSLVDLRRLSSNPSEAVNRLKQKFVNLRDESYPLFMQSWSSWQSSPLFLNYIEAVDDALSQRKHLSLVTGEKEKISPAEIDALITMEKDLDI